MLAGLILIVTGTFFLTAAVLLPRILKPIAELLGGLPLGLLAGAEGIPGGGLLRLLPLLNHATKAAFLAGFVAVGIGLFGLFKHPTPLWLNLLATLSALLLLTIGGGLTFAAKRFGPMVGQMNQMKNMFKM